jgi:protein TonB
MFNNLIESTSHAKEYKRRGSFVLFTTGVYAVLLLLGGVASIYAYDAHLEAQTTQLEIISFVPPQEIVPEQPEPTSRPDRPRENSRNETGIPERATAMLSVNHPEIVPENISTTPNKNLPLPESGPVVIRGRDRDFGPAGGTGPQAGSGRQVVTPAQIVTLPDPPPAPAPTPVKVLKISKVLNSQALLLPRPAYPPLARQIKVQGTVAVQVLIDENGQVISAKALSGHPLLVPEAQKAAMGARFSPTLISDQPVKISGVITYNFVMNN